MNLPTSGEQLHCNILLPSQLIPVETDDAKMNKLTKQYAKLVILK